MHMFMWFGYDLGPFLFAGLDVTTRWAFAITWVALFLVALLFEASKVYLAKTQRCAQKKLYPYRSDERRNLLCQEQGGAVEPGTSRNASSGQVGRWGSLKTRVLINCHQSLVFVLHNAVGYLLMLAVMLYNAHLLLAVVAGMMLGYFLFGAKLTRLQMQCFRTKRVVICTPECDDTDRCNTEKCSWEVCEGKLCKQMDAIELQQQDTRFNKASSHVVETQRKAFSDISLFPAENSTPPLLDASLSSESDFFICQTRTCIQPSHYFRASTSQDATQDSNTCYFGAKACPSKVARAKKQEAQKHCHDKEPSVEAQLLGDQCCKKDNKVETTIVVHEHKSCCKEDDSSGSQDVQVRENSPQITCCHSAKAVPAESQEQIV